MTPEQWLLARGSNEAICLCSDCLPDKAKLLGEYVSAAIASAEARARLEEAKWWRYLVRMHEESYFAREGDIRIRELEAAARTPDSTKEQE